MVEPSLLEPFWTSTLMRGESLFLIKDAADDSVSATLLFPPSDGISLTTSAGDELFVEGRDYRLDRTTGRVLRLEGSGIPFTTQDELYPLTDPDGSRFMHRRGEPRSYLMFAEGDVFHRRQVVATYQHGAGLWAGSVPAFAGARLPRTRQRLQESQPLTICLTGDSISEGYNASGFIGVPPYQPAFGPMVAAELQRAYGSPVVLHNFATAGWTTDHGIADAGRVGTARPDLAIIAFGANDAGFATADDYSANINELMAEVSRSSPGVEFALVSPMLSHAEWHYPILERVLEYRDALGRLCRPGVILADVTSVWSGLLARKTSYDLSGNGINHPNDFGHRVYAQVLLALLSDRGADS